MLKKVDENEFEQYLDFFYSLALNQEKSAYPTYTDGIKTKTDFICSCKQAFASENDEILLFEWEGIVEGMIHYYVIPEDDYIGISAFNMNAKTEIALQEFTEYLKKLFGGYTVYFGFPTANTAAISFLERNDFFKEEESLVDVLHFCNYEIKKEASGTVRVTEENYEDFAKLHAECDEGMYWNTQRLKENLKEWKIYLYYKAGAVSGAIYYINMDTTMEIFGIDFVNQQYEEETFRALLLKALNEGKRAGVEHLTYFNDEIQHPILETLGFDFVGNYVLYTKKL